MPYFSVTSTVRIVGTNPKSSEHLRNGIQAEKIAVGIIKNIIEEVTFLHHTSSMLRKTVRE